MNPDSLGIIILITKLFAIIFGVITDRAVNLIYSRQRKDLRKSFLYTSSLFEKNTIKFIEGTIKFRKLFSDSVLEYKDRIMSSDDVMLDSYVKLNDLREDQSYIQKTMPSGNSELISIIVRDESAYLKHSSDLINNYLSTGKNIDLKTELLNNGIRTAIVNINNLRDISHEISIDSLKVLLEKAAVSYRNFLLSGKSLEVSISDENLFDAVRFRTDLSFSYRQILNSFKHDTSRLYRILTKEYRKTYSSLRFLNNTNAEYLNYLNSYFVLDKIRRKHQGYRVFFAEVKLRSDGLYIKEIVNISDFAAVCKNDSCFLEMYADYDKISGDIIKKLYTFDDHQEYEMPLFVIDSRGRYILKKPGNINKTQHHV